VDALRALIYCVMRQELETLGEVLLNPWFPPVKLLQNAGHSERSEAESKNLPE
jgi:hypothetical protein